MKTTLLLPVFLTASVLAAPVIDPIGDVSIPAGKSLIVPVTATSPGGQPLTYKVTSSTNAIAVVMHTNNPFWQLSVAQVVPTNAPGAYQTPYRGGLMTVTNVGNLTFMLFPEYAPHTVNVCQGLTTAGFYNSNTIFHRVISNFMIQGGDANTNGSGRLVFEFDDEFHPQAMFTGNGQLAVANHGKDTGGAQFFVTAGPQRFLDFGYTLFGQLVRGFEVLTNINSTAVNANDRPLADEIIQTASYVPNTADTVLTLIATNVLGVTGTITVIADDGVGGRTTNRFSATLVADTNGNNQPFFYPNTVTNLVGPVNTTLTNFVNAVELGGDKLYWFPSFVGEADYTHASGSSYNLSNNVLRALTYSVTNVDGQIQLFLVPSNNYVGPVSMVFDVSYHSWWSFYQQNGYNLPNYDEQVYTFIFGDTPIAVQGKTVAALAPVPFSNVLLATFTNGVPGSSITNFSASINWGDNSTNSGVVTANAAGQKAVLGSHTYVYPGTYPVYVRVQSAIGANATALSFVTVTNQAAAATNLLTVQITGQGTVSPDYNNASLPVGGSYTISASPADLWVLTSWTDGNGYVLGTGTNLSFTMYPGLRLAGNFMINELYLVPRTATATVIVTNGFLVAAAIEDAGYGYTSAPPVFIIGGGGSGAQATATINHGVVTAINIVNAGCGYISTPTIAIGSPFPHSLNIKPVTRLSFTNLVLSGSYQLQSGQSGTWSNLDSSFVAQSGVYSKYLDGLVNGVCYRLLALPVSYGATATPELAYGFVVAATLGSGGYGYISIPSVRIIGGGGSGAQAAATISNGVVTAIIILSAGYGYTSIPAIQIDPPPLSAQVPSAVNAVRLDYDNLIPQVRYQLQTSFPLGAWTNFGLPFTAATSTNSQYIDMETLNRFFRFRSMP